MASEGPEPRDTWRDLGPTLVDVVDSIATPLALLTPELRFVAVNRAFCGLVERTAGEMIGREVFDVFPEVPIAAGDDMPDLRETFQRVVETATAQTSPLLRYDVARNDGGAPDERYWHITNVPILDATGRLQFILNSPEEVTDYLDDHQGPPAVSAGVDGTSLTSRITAIDSAFTAAISRLKNLNDLAAALVGATDEAAIGRALVSDGLPMAGAVGGTLVMVDGGEATLIEHAGIAEDLVQRFSRFAITAGAEPISDALLDGQTRFYPDPDALLADYPSLAAAVLRSGQQAWAVVPLRIGDESLGAAMLAYAEPHPFSPPMRLVLYTLASMLAQATARARLLEEQNAAMRSVEAAFRSNLDPLAGFVVSDLYRPASTATLAGGDWYDITTVSGRCSLVAIGDVANHGAVAVGEMARCRSTVHALALQGLAPDVIATQVDHVLARVSTTFTTSVVGVLDVVTCEFKWTTAGHPQPILRRADGTAEFLGPTHGAPLGSGMEAEYGSSSTVLRPGDTLVLYTDGLVERPDERIDVGLQRLRELVERTRPSASMSAVLFDALVDAHHLDDVAVITLHATG